MTLRVRLLLVLCGLSLIPMADILYRVSRAEGRLFMLLLVPFVIVLLGSVAFIWKIDGFVDAAQARAAKADASLRTFIESVHVGIFTIDAAGKLLEINTAMAELLGYEPDFLSGRDFWSYVKDGQAQAGDLRRWPEHRSRDSLELLAKRKDGSRLALQVEFHRLGATAGEGPYRGFARVVEPALQEREMKSAILAALHGELRETLDSLRFTGDDARSPAKLLQGLVRIREELVARLDAGYFDSASFSPCNEPVEASLLILQLYEFFQPMAGRKGIELAHKLPESAVTFMGDGNLLFIALRNLVSNALKFSRQGGRVEIGAEVLPKSLLFTVRDSGIGMSRETMASLFKPFRRADTAATARVGGLGLGLWIVQRIVRAHKGEVWAESAMGQGSTFHIRLTRVGSGQDR